MTQEQPHCAAARFLRDSLFRRLGETPLRVVAFFSLILSSFAGQVGADDYYVSVNGSDNGNGTVSQPWKSMNHAIGQLRPGDTLIVGAGHYKEPNRTVRIVHSGSKTRSIVVRSSQQNEKTPTVVWEPARIDMRPKAVSDWRFEGICFRPTQTAFLLGDPQAKVKASRITFRNCRFENKQALKIGYADDVLVDGCYFYRIQSEQRGEDMHAISAQHYAHRLTIRNCQFEDISADGVQVGQSAGDLREVLIEGCRFWINRDRDGTLKDKRLQQRWGNTGENGIDIKQVDADGSVAIRGCEISGYRPTLPGQNATGAFGAGIVIHFGSHNITVSRCRLRDNSQGVTVGGSRTATGPPAIVRIENCLIHDNSQVGIHVRESRSVHLVHNTFARNGLNDEGRSYATGTVGGGRRQMAAHLWVSRDAADLQITNNLFWQGMAVDGPGAARRALNANYNCWASVDVKSQSFPVGANSLHVDDPKVDAATFKPNASSPIVRRAQPLDVRTDYAGSQRNAAPTIGALEPDESPGVQTDK